MKTWTPHRFLVAAARKTWRWSPERRAVLKAAQVGKAQWKCFKCGNVFTQVEYTTKKGRKRKRMEGAVDHIVPIGKQPSKWSDYPAYYKKTFCPISNLQILCKACHDSKTSAEKAAKRD